MMSLPSLTRVPVAPGAEGVDAVAAAVSPIIAGEGPPIAVYPQVRKGQPDRHGAMFAAAVRADAPVDNKSVAVVIPTSGSSGEPRGVLLSREALIAAADAQHEALQGPGLWLTAVPVTGIGGLMTVVRSLRAGHDASVLPGVGGASPFTPDAFAVAVDEFVRRAGDLGMPAYTSLVPTQLSRLVAADPALLEPVTRLSALLVGGSPLPDQVRHQAATLGIPVIESYGATETCGGVVYDGIPVPGVDVGINDEGRIEVGGPTVAMGYRLRPDLTERNFASGRFLSRDEGRFQNGRLTILGRQDQIVKVGGHKVSLRAVTEVLRSHPRVIEAITVGSPDREWGQVPISVIVPDDTVVTSTDFDHAELIQQLQDQVAESLGRASTPRRIEIRSELPTLHSGKSDQVGWHRTSIRED